MPVSDAETCEMSRVVEAVAEMTRPPLGAKVPFSLPEPRHFKKLFQSETWSLKSPSRPNLARVSYGLLSLDGWET